MKQKVTIEDVAKHCHVSKSSVSRYLNHGYVSAEHKEKIKQAIEELGFERDFFASRIKAKHTKMIGIIVNDIGNEKHAKILAGMQAKLKELDYQGIISISDGKKEQEKECLQNLILQGVDGVIFLDCVKPEHVKDMVQEHHVKVIFANRTCDYAPFLGLDEKYAGKILGEYCLSQQAHRFVYLQEDEQLAKARRAGFMSAYGDHTCEMDVVKVKQLKDIPDIMKDIIGKPYEVVLCENEKTALAIVKYAHEIHIHIPQNISLICFNDGEWCCLSHPAITALAYDYAIFGKNLVEEMAALNENREPQWQENKYEIVKRESMRSY